MLDFPGIKHWLLVAILSLLTNICLFAQISVKQLLLTDSTASILYRYAYNEIRITGLQTGDEARIGGTPVRIGTGNIIGYSPKHVKTDTLFILRNRKTIFKQVYRIDSLTEPKVRLGGITGAYATVAQILAYPRLLIYFPNTVYNGEWVVLGFSISYQIKKTAGLPLNIRGDRLSEEAKSQIKLLHPGDKLTFDAMRVIGPDGTARALDPFTITIR